MSKTLPNSYQEVEYIESNSQFPTNGYTYIDLDLFNYTDCKIICKLNQKTSYSDNNYFGYIGIDGKNKLEAGIGWSNNNLSANFGGQGIQIRSPILTSKEWHTLEINIDGYYTDGVLRDVESIYTNNGDWGYFTKSISIQLFGTNRSHLRRYYPYLKISSFMVFKNNIEKINLIPCYRKSDNEPGLYDLVNDKFYTNNGTGVFTLGPEVYKKEIVKEVSVDWSDSMEQTFEYYEVDPNTWKDIKPLQMVKSCSIKRDDGTDTLGSATIDINDTLGECYVRVYLIIRQNGGTFKFTLGTFLVQTPSSSYDGKNRNVSMDCYTPLLELKENPPPLGFALLKNDNIMKQAYMIVRDNCRAPVVETTLDKTLQDNFVAEPNEKWLNYISDLIAQAKYKLALDEEGRILFAPKQKIDELQPIWTYNDDNSSILYPEVSMQHDLYGIPNVVEVVCSTGVQEYTARVVNDDPNSPTSTINRGREILYRETDPNLPGFPSEEQIDEYAKNLLETLSSVEYQISYTHGYCPVRVGDAVRLNYKRAGLNGIKAKVISQSIKCENGCSVSETAVFTKKLWN